MTRVPAMRVTFGEAQAAATTPAEFLRLAALGQQFGGNVPSYPRTEA